MSENRTPRFDRRSLRHVGIELTLFGNMGAEQFDPVGVLETAYQPFPDARAWLDAVACEISHPFDREGRGTISYFMDPSDFQPRLFKFAPREGATIGADQAIASLLAGLEHAGCERLRRFASALGRAGAFSLVRSIGARIEPALAPLGKTIGDSPAVVIPTGEGLTAVVATYTDRVLTLPRESRALWERIAIHLGAACRIAPRLHGTGAPDVEAILTPDGRMLDAQPGATDPEARVVLRDGVRRMEKARTRRYRKSPIDALGLWGALLAGRWSLVESVESDGRRFVLARRNDPDPPRPPELTRRQRQVLCYASAGWSLKQIGYALGISEGSVTYHLRHGMRKIGIGSRLELVRRASDAAAQSLSAAMAGNAPTQGTSDTLTAAERLVVAHVVEGASNEAIARARGVSVRTVANQLTSIYRKLDVRDRVELTRIATARSSR